MEVLGHYAKGRIPAELAAVDRQRGRVIQRIADSLRERSFVPKAAALIFIPKPGHPGERRPIALVRPEDRIVLTTLNRILAPLFESHFLPQSYAYRSHRSAWQAVERVSLCLGQGLTQAAGDIGDFERAEAFLPERWGPHLNADSRIFANEPAPD